VTDRHNQFYEKFSMRQNIGDILMHCWTLQPHRSVPCLLPVVVRQQSMHAVSM
jgi:hypothetical protein